MCTYTPSRKPKDVCKLLEACEERVRGVMEDCGLLGVSRSTETLSAELAADSIEAAQHAFYHSGINPAQVPPGSEPVTEGAGKWTRPRSEGLVWTGGKGGACTHCQEWPQLFNHRPSHPYNTWAEHVEFSPTRNTGKGGGYSLSCMAVAV